MIKEDVGTLPNFKIEGATGSPLFYYTGELRFLSSDGDATLSLENGGVHIRYWSSPGSAMLANPSWYYDPMRKTYVIQFIRMNGTSDMAQTGIGTIRMQLSDPPQQQVFDISGDVYITYNSDPEWDYQTAWKNYLTTSDLEMTDQGASKYKLNSNAETLVIKSYNVTFLSL